MNPPTDSELRSRLILEAVQQIAEHLVNTNESVEVFLARQKGALDDGDKQAAAGLWERALETFETAPPLNNKEDDAYRLYNIGVAYEALAYQAENVKAAMKYLDEAAINYGKAIDAKPAEKYFLEPQKRIETAIAHYKELEEESKPKPVVAAAAPSNPSGSESKPTVTTAVKGLTNAQVIAMVKSGMDDDTVAQAIRSAKAVNFDLSDAGQKDLTGNGISSKVLAAMKARAATKPTTNKPAAAK
jgi:tetratricopeptide (TPR) repeat protein